MSFEELALFQIHPDRSWPFINEFKASQGDDRNYGRRVVNPVFSQVDNALVSWEDGGETAVILGNGLGDWLIVLCARINHQWYAIRPAFFPTTLASVLDDDDALEEVRILGRTAAGMIQPHTFEVITTGDYKSELDGLYQVIPKNNGSGTRMTASSKYCVGPDLIRKPGAAMLFEAIPAIDFFGDATYDYKAAFTHPHITTTVYESTDYPYTFMTKTSGDDSMPDDIAWLNGFFARMPLWFDIDSDDASITGLYTLWPGYYDDPSWSALTRTTMHAPDGTRMPVTYFGTYVQGTPDYFRLQIGVPSGGALRYKCNLEDFSFENGSRMTFTIESNTSSATVPDTIIARRPKTGYCRTVKEEDQLT